MSKADLSKQPAQVAAMFDEVSTHYDRTNTVLSMGNAALWRAATTRAVAPRPGETILDVAAGTGTSSASLARNGASVVAADFSEGMIEVGRRRQADNPFISFVQADATALPFEDDTFDAVTISFGLRNIVDPRKALAEFHRVTKPGGRVVICEFSHPVNGVIRTGYDAYLKYGMPLLARLSSSNPAAYEYLMDSIQAWPDQPTLADWLREAGFEGVQYRNLTAGIVALHRGRKPVRAAVAGKAGVAAEAAKSRAEKPAAVADGGEKVAAGRKPATAKPAGEKPVAAKEPATAKSATVTSAGEKPAAAKKPATAKPAGAKPATGKPATAKPAAAKPTAAAAAATKPATAKTAPAKPAATKPTSPKSTAAKPAAASKPAPAKSAAAKSTAATSAAAKSTSAKPAAAKPATTRSTAAKSTPAKPATAKSTTAKPATAKSTTAKAAPSKSAAKPATAKRAGATSSATTSSATTDPATTDPATAKPAASKPGTAGGASSSAVPPEGE